MLQPPTLTHYSLERLVSSVMAHIPAGTSRGAALSAAVWAEASHQMSWIRQLQRIPGITLLWLALSTIRTRGPCGPAQLASVAGRQPTTFVENSPMIDLKITSHFPRSEVSKSGRERRPFSKQNKLDFVIRWSGKKRKDEVRAIKDNKFPEKTTTLTI